MSEHTAENGLLATAECRVCGERVARIEAPLHVEEHRQRGEFPTTVIPPGKGA